MTSSRLRLARSGSSLVTYARSWSSAQRRRDDDVEKARVLDLFVHGLAGRASELRAMNDAERRLTWSSRCDR